MVIFGHILDQIEGKHIMISNKHIFVLTTGGTIASVATGTGLKPGNSPQFQKFDYAKEFKNLYPMGEFCNKSIRTKHNVTLSYEVVINKDSTNIEPSDWKVILRAIEGCLQKEECDGIVVTHGTDTMAYTLAQLAYYVQGLKKPVVFTGSQIPFGEPNSDATKNLVDAITVACSDFQGLCLCFCGKIIDATCAKKVYAKAIAAFESVGKKDFGYIESDGTAFFYSENENQESQHKYDMKVSASAIACIKLLPGMSQHILDALAESGCRAIILEVFGCGGIPHYLLESIQKLIQKDILICAISQCLYDGTDISLYEVGLEAKKAGVLSAGNMTIESVYAKLCLILEHTDSYQDAIDLWNQI